MPSYWPTDSSRRTATRATAPLVGGLLLVALTVVLATVVGTAVLGVGAADLGTASALDPAPVATVDLTVSGDTLRFTHENGEALNVRALSIRITVDGEPLAEQPPVPFFSASGFEPGPTGPFNTASDPQWSVGETATLTVAGTNSPAIEPGSTVAVRIISDGNTVVRTETTA